MLFNKDDNGSLELKELIGFIYKSINFNNLKSYIRMAERDMIRIIGKDVFQTAQDHYNSDNYQAEPVEGEDESIAYQTLDLLVARIQYPVAIHAYRKYVPNADLTHGDKGRQIYVSENEKPAFEWMIEKDNDNLIRLANEATDILLEFLDDHIEDTHLVGEEGEEEEALLIPWADSDAYNLTKSLFINTVDEFQEVFMIGNSRFTFLSLAPILRRVQENELKPCFGESLYTDIMEEIKAREITGDNKPVLDRARQALGLLTLSIAVKRLTVDILPDGLFLNQVSGLVKSKLAAGKVDRNEVSVSLQRDGMVELRKLQDYLAKLAAEEAGTTLEETDLTAHIDADLKFVRL